MYKNLRIDRVPSLDEVGTPGGRHSLSMHQFEEMTHSHFNKGIKRPTAWISCSPSLKMALQFLFKFCRDDGTLFIIRVCDCPDIYNSPAVTEALPNISVPLRKKWHIMMNKDGKLDEYVVFGKIPPRAIAATISVRQLLNCRGLYTIWPGLQPLMATDFGMPTMMFAQPRSRVTTEMIDAAIDVVSKFEGTDEYTLFWLARVLLGSDFFNPYQERADGEWLRLEIRNYFVTKRQAANDIEAADLRQLMPFLHP